MKTNCDWLATSNFSDKPQSPVNLDMINADNKALYQALGGDEQGWSTHEAQEITQGVTNHRCCKAADLTSTQWNRRVASALDKHLSQLSGSTGCGNVSPRFHQKNANVWVCFPPPMLVRLTLLSDHMNWTTNKISGVLHGVSTHRIPSGDEGCSAWQWCGYYRDRN